MIGYLSLMQYDLAAGIHWYGTLRIKDQERGHHDVKHVLNAATARRLNKDDRHRGDGPTYRAGQETQRFTTKGSCHAAGITLAKSLGCKWLFEGSSAVCDPQHVIYGPDEAVVTQLNALWQEAEANDGWDGNNKTMQSICDRWDALWKPIYKGAA
jgi:hypothetical protein